MLSVRGMMVHSAKWTPEMIRIGNIKDIIPLCGYGVPDEETALFSNEKYATFIFENELIPYWEKMVQTPIINCTFMICLGQQRCWNKWEKKM